MLPPPLYSQHPLSRLAVESVGQGYGLWEGTISLTQETSDGQRATYSIVDLYSLLEHEWQLLKMDLENEFSLVLPSVSVFGGQSTPPQRAAGWLSRHK